MVQTIILHCQNSCGMCVCEVCVVAAVILYIKVLRRSVFRILKGI